MQPMDAMWTIKPPTVADTFGGSNVVFKSAIKNTNNDITKRMTITEGEIKQEPSSPMPITPRTRHFSISETFGSPLIQAFSWASSPRQRSVSVCEPSDHDLKEMLKDLKRAADN